MIEHTEETCNCQGRVCIDCKKLCCIAFFHIFKASNGKDYRRKRCVECLRAAQRNDERKKEYQKQYRSKPKSKEVRRFYQKERMRNDPDYKATQIAYQKSWMKRNGRYIEDKAKVSTRAKAWRESHPERRAETKAAYKARRRAQIKASASHFTAKEWRDLKNQYNHTCLCCSKREPEIKLTPDHVLPLSKGGSNGIENIQPLCFPCNMAKHDKFIDFRPRNP